MEVSVPGVMGLRRGGSQGESERLLRIESSSEVYSKPDCVTHPSCCYVSSGLSNKSQIKKKKTNSDSHLSGPVHGAVNASKEHALSPGSSKAFDQRNDTESRLQGVETAVHRS